MTCKLREFRGEDRYLPYDTDADNDDADDDNNNDDDDDVPSIFLQTFRPHRTHGVVELQNNGQSWIV